MANTQKLLIGGLILMVVLNLCTLGFILFRPHHGGRGPECGIGFDHGKGHHRNPFKELNLTPEQEEKMIGLKTQLDTKMDSIRQKADKLREERFALLKSEPIDQAAANTKAIEIGNCFAQMEKITFEHFLAVKKILTKEQQAGFEKFIEQMCRRQGRHHMKGMHGDGFGPGPG